MIAFCVSPCCSPPPLELDVLLCGSEFGNIVICDRKVYVDKVLERYSALSVLHCRL